MTLYTARVLSRAEGMGLMVRERAVVDYNVLDEALSLISGAGIGRETVRELRALGRRGDAEVWRDRLNRLYLQMEESPVPHEEWRHLLTMFDADQLGSL
ncbi:MAG: hypothetical protein ACYDAG_09500, partial [Chloroflexota bacterium]